jgi:hypothetical protein
VAWTASGGSITAGGLYTAPNTAGTYTVTARHAESGARREALVVVSSAAGARVEPIYHSVLLETSAQFTPTLNDGPQPVSTRRVDHTAGQAVKVRDVAWSDESSLSGGITEVADPTWTPWSASASTKASLALEYALSASGAVTRVAGSGSARGDASESAAGYMGYALKLGASGAASHDLYFRVVGGPVRFTASYRCTAALQDGFTNGIQSNFLIRSTTTYMPADPAFLYCNAWGKPSVDQTVTGVLEPGEYLLKVNAGAEAFAASWNKDLSVGTAAYQFSVTFQP